MGIIDLYVGNGTLKNITKRDPFSTEVNTEVRNANASISWKFSVPKSTEYTLELTYSAPAPKTNMQLILDDKRLGDFPLIKTHSWNNFIPIRPQKCTIMAGSHELVFKLGNGMADNVCLLRLRFIPSSLIKKIPELKKQSIFDLSIEEMDLIYGKSSPYDFNSTKFGEDCSDQKNPELIHKVKSDLKVYYWVPKLGYIMYAGYLHGKCVILQFNLENQGLALNKVIEHVRPRLGGMKFTVPPGYKRGQQVVSYVKEGDKEYALLFFDTDYFIVKDIGTLKKQ